MLAQIILFVLDTVCGFLTLALLVRFAMQWTRAPFRNPLGQFIVAVTDWMVRPVRGAFVPGLFGVDMASLLLAWLWQVVFQGVALGFPGCCLSFRQHRLWWSLLLAALEVAKIGLYLVMGAVLVRRCFPG
jgi:YggT family protein